MDPKALDRILPVLIGTVLGAALWVNWQHRREAREREQAVADQITLAAQHMLSIRIESLFHEWAEDARAEALAAASGIDEPALLQRWAVLMGAQWPITSIRLADAQGNEVALHHADTALLLTRTWRARTDSQTMAWRFKDGLPDGEPFLWPPLARYDPRERVWFSKALENSQEVPVWSERQFGDTARRVLQASLIVPGSGAGDAYRVLLFDIDMGRAAPLDTRSPWLARNGMLLLNAEGQVYAASPAATREPMAQVLSQALPQWIQQKFNRALIVEHGGSSYAVQVDQVQLNGLRLNAAMAVDVSALTAATRKEALDYSLESALLAALGLLLVLLALRSGVRRKEARRQERQMRIQEKRLSKALGERDVLSREVHHRVKNNLQVVSSLLNLQASSLDDEGVRQEFLRGKRRIDTIALVHHRLYDQPDLRAVNLNHFLGHLARSIAGLHEDRRQTVSIAIQADGLTCDQDTAIELGIIVCELVDNAYQHAFPHATGGHIDVSVSRVEGDLHRLVVSNNGVPAGKDGLTGPGKLGLEIVEALAEQLDGSLHVRTQGQMAFEVLFRMRRKAPALDPGLPEEGP